MATFIANLTIWDANICFPMGTTTKSFSNLNYNVLLFIYLSFAVVKLTFNGDKGKIVHPIIVIRNKL